jgi:acetyl-CoA carboxylase biotin carboxyl carrier protein
MSAINDDDLRWLLTLLEQEGLSEIEVREGDSEVLVRATVATCGPLVPAAAGPAVALTPALPAEAPLAENHLPVLSPMAGVFYRSPTPDAPPFVQEGDHVAHGDTIGLVEAMKLFNEIPAPASGTILRFLVESEDRVEADQPLMIMEVHGR